MLAVAYQCPSGVLAGRLLRKACIAKNVQLKAIALDCQTDLATLSRGLHGLGPLDMNKLLAAPEKVLRRWFRLMLAAKLAQWETDSQEKSA